MLAIATSFDPATECVTAASTAVPPSALSNLQLMSAVDILVAIGGALALTSNTYLTDDVPADNVCKLLIVSYQSPLALVTTLVDDNATKEFFFSLSGAAIVMVAPAALVVSSAEVTVGTPYFFGIVITKDSLAQKNTRVRK